MAIASYSNELKDQVIKEVQETGSIPVVAKRHGLIPRTVNNWMRGFRDKDKILDRRKVRDLNREVQNLRIQNELLKALLKKTVQVLGPDEKQF